MKRVVPIMAFFAAGAMILAVAFGMLAPTARSRSKKIFGEADRMIALGRYAEAQAEIERISPDPAARDAESWLRLGMCRSMQKEFQAAADCFEEGLKVSPNEERLLYNQALLYDRMNEKEKAAAALLKLKKSAPYYPQVAYHLGRLAEDRGDLKTADSYYVEELNLNPMAQNAWERHLKIARPAGVAEKASMR